MRRQAGSQAFGVDPCAGRQELTTTVHRRNQETLKCQNSTNRAKWLRARDFLAAMLLGKRGDSEAARPFVCLACTHNREAAKAAGRGLGGEEEEKLVFVVVTSRRRHCHKASTAGGGDDYHCDYDYDDDYYYDCYYYYYYSSSS